MALLNSGRSAATLIAFALLCGCASLGTTDRGTTTRGCAVKSVTLESKPGRQWLREQRWRYRDDAQAIAAYRKLVDAASPWPDWMRPQATTLPIGARFQIAIGGAQTPAQPGGFGTFDNINSAADVRGNLAVRKEWKERIDRVVTYEVIRPLAVNVGSVGPQVDGRLCRLLMGRWSQLEMLVAPSERMSHLKVIEVRRLR